MLQSEMRYGLNIGAIRYLAAVMISKAVRICRLRKFCEQAAFHCLQHLETGHLVNLNCFDLLKLESASLLSVWWSRFLASGPFLN